MGAAVTGPDSIGSQRSVLSIGWPGSILSIGSVGSVLSIGSAGSILSIGSFGSILSVGSAGSVFSIFSSASLGTIMSSRSRWAVQARGSDGPDGSDGGGALPAGGGHAQVGLCGRAVPSPVTATTATIAAQDATAAEVARRMTDDGYVIVTGMMSGEDVQAGQGRSRPGPGVHEDRARLLLERLLDPARLRPVRQDHGRSTRRPSTPWCSAVLDGVLGPATRLSAPVGIQIGPGEAAQILHRDEAIYPLPATASRRRASTRCGRSMTSPRRTAPPGSSPESHLLDDRATGTRRDGRTMVRSRRCPPGSAMFYLGNLWHGGGANRDRAAAARRDPRVRRQAGSGHRRTTAWPCPAPWRGELPERLQELLGYNIYPPFVGYVDGAHPRKVLAKEE